MKPDRNSGAGLIVLAIGGVLALNYPLLSLFDRDTSVFSIPLPFIHLFFVWALLIGGIAILVERQSKNVTPMNTDASNVQRGSVQPLSDSTNADN